MEIPKSNNTGQSIHVENISQEEKEISVPDSSIVENIDGLTFPIESDGRVVFTFCNGVEVGTEI